MLLDDVSSAESVCKHIRRRRRCHIMLQRVLDLLRAGVRMITTRVPTLTFTTRRGVRSLHVRRQRGADFRRRLPGHLSHVRKHAVGLVGLPGRRRCSHVDGGHVFCGPGCHRFLRLLVALTLLALLHGRQRRRRLTFFFRGHFLNAHINHVGRLRKAFIVRASARQEVPETHASL